MTEQWRDAYTSPEPGYAVYPNVPTNDGPTWGFRCLTCGNAQDGYIKERYAHDEGRNHAATCNGDPGASGGAA